MDSAANEPRGIKLLFIGNNEWALSDTFTYLAKRGWSCRFVSSMHDALESASQDPPDFVLVSWNLISPNVLNVEKAVRMGLNILCIVYTEVELDPQKQTSLLASGIKNFILAPVSGTSVFVKVRALASAKLAEEKNNEESASLLYGDSVFGADTSHVRDVIEEELRNYLESLPKDAEWEEITPTEDKKPVWIVKGEVSRESLIVFKGDVPPTFKNDAWTISGAGGKFQEYRKGNQEDYIRIKNKIEKNEQHSKPLNLDSESTSGESEAPVQHHTHKSKGAWRSKISLKNVDAARAIEEFKKEFKIEDLSGDEVDQDDETEDETDSDAAVVVGGARVSKKESVHVTESSPSKPVAEKNNLRKSENFNKDEKTEWKIKSEKRSKKRNKETEPSSLTSEKVPFKDDDSPNRDEKKLSRLTAAKTQSKVTKQERKSFLKSKADTKAQHFSETVKSKKSEHRAQEPQPEEDSVFKNKVTQASDKKNGDNPVGMPSIGDSSDSKDSQREKTGKSSLSRMVANQQENQLRKTPRESSKTAQSQRAKQSVSGTKSQLRLAPEETKKPIISKNPEASQKEELQIKPGMSVEFEKWRKEKREALEKSALTHKDGKSKLYGKMSATPFAKSVFDFMSEVVKKEKILDTQSQIPLNLVTHLDCIPVRSKSLKGLLIFATSANKHCGLDFSKAVQQQVTQLMKKSGEYVRDEGVLQIEVPPFRFLEVAAEIAQFVTVTEHMGIELGMAFLESEGVFPDIGDANPAGMCSVDIEDLRSNENIGFDAFIYLPRNDKYIKYLNKGGVLAPYQKEHMVEYKVKHFYIKQEDSRKVKTQYVSSFVQKVVEELLEAIHKKSAA